MARIILSKGSTVLSEMTLSKERVTIGRRPQSDIRIDDLAVSGEHAVIVTLDNDSFLEDLNSTNGTQVNGQPVRKHFLQDQDVIELAQYRIRYVVAGPVEEQEAGGSTAIAFSASMRLAKIRILNGPNAGRETVLTKALTTFGRPGIQVAAIARRADAYYVSCVEGSVNPTVNGEMVCSGERQVFDGDLIELSDTQLRFHWI